MARTQGSAEGAAEKAQTLRPLGLSEDGKAVLLGRRANARTPSFRLPLDDALVKCFEDAGRRPARVEPRSSPPSPATKVASKLSIKEIQAMLRQGRSAASVARSAGVGVDWVERFEPPIIWERAGMAARARRGTLVRSRSGPSSGPLGDSVAANLKRRGIAYDPDAPEDAWDSRRMRSGSWIVSLTFSSRGREHRAEWVYDPETGDLRARNKLGVELGWVRPKRKRSV